MNTNTKKCLFGGALLGAGLCSSATASSVDWIGGSGSAGAFDAGIDHHDDFLSSGGWDATAAFGTASARSYAGTFGLDLMADGGNGTGYARTFGSFTVANNTSMLLSWDVDQAFIFIVDISSGPVLNFSPFNEAGSVGYTFLTGTTYTVDVYIGSFGFGGPPSTFTMNTVTVVPLPPVAFGGLAMLAGLGAYRRVRR